MCSSTKHRCCALIAFVFLSVLPYCLLSSCLPRVQSLLEGGRDVTMEKVLDAIVWREFKGRWSGSD